MQCFHHPEAPARAICTRCDHPLCENCAVERKGRNFCPTCAQFLDRREVQRTTGSIPIVKPGAAAPGAAAPGAAAPVTQPPAAPQRPPATVPSPAQSPPQPTLTFQPPPPPSAPPASSPTAVGSEPFFGSGPAAPAPSAPPISTPAPAASEPYLGPPAAELSSVPKPSMPLGDDEIIGLAEEPEKPSEPLQTSRSGVYSGPAGAQVGSGTGSSGDLFGGPPAQPGTPAENAQGSGVHQGEVYQGDVYQGDVYPGDGDPGGDLYQGPESHGAAASGVGSAMLAAEETSQGVPLRGLIVGIFAGTVAAVIWYGLAVTTGIQFGFISWLIGIGVGIATVAGTGRGGTDVALMAAGITAIALLMGEFQIEKRFDAQFIALEEEAATIELDGDYTDQEIATLAGIPFDEFEKLGNNEKEVLRTMMSFADDDYDDDYYDDYDDPDSVSDVLDPYDSQPLTLGYFIGHLPSFLGLKGIIIWMVGIGGAFRLGLGKLD